MEKITDVYEKCSVKELVNSIHNWITEESEFEANLAKQETALAASGWEIGGWVKVKEGKEIPMIEGEPASYLLRLGLFGKCYTYCMVVKGEKILLDSNELKERINGVNKPLLRFNF